MIQGVRWRWHYPDTRHYTHSTNPQYDAERRHGPRLLSILHLPESLLYTTLCHQTPPSSSSGTAPWNTSPFSLSLYLSFHAVITLSLADSPHASSPLLSSSFHLSLTLSFTRLCFTLPWLRKPGNTLSREY